MRYISDTMLRFENLSSVFVPLTLYLKMVVFDEKHSNLYQGIDGAAKN